MNDAITTDAVTIRKTEPHEKSLFAYSHSITEAILTCPIWGIVRYVKGLYYPVTNRAMALEAGGALHEVFAAVRLWQLFRRQGYEEHFKFHARRLFNAIDPDTGQPEDYGRFEQIWQEIPDNERDELINFCFQVLNSGEFYDDPSDTTRTLAHMEETIIRYCDDRLGHMERNPIWVADPDDPTAPVGVEQTFDVMVTFQGRTVRYIGTIDGIIERQDGEIMIDENKTASRLDETWRKAFAVKSQPTGYIAVARLMTGYDVTRTRIIGCKVKQQRSQEDMLSFIEERDDEQIADWARTLMFTDRMVHEFRDQPLDAPKFTHSCSRYFRPCAFIDMCSAGRGDQQDIYDGLVPAELTPSQKAVQGG